MHYFLKISGSHDKSLDFYNEKGDDLIKKIEALNETESKMLGS
jgi:hypothetical protein